MRRPEIDPETEEELPAPKVYEPVSSLAALRTRVAEHMGKFNASYKLYATQLTLFQDALEHFVTL